MDTRDNKSRSIVRRVRGRVRCVRDGSHAAAVASNGSPATLVSPSAVAAVVGALLKHRRVDTARSMTQTLEQSDRYTLTAGFEFLTATAAVEAESGASGSTRTTNKVFHQVLQSPASLTDDVIRQIIRVDLNNGQIESAVAKLDTVLNLLASSQQSGAITSGAFTPLAMYVIRQDGLVAFEDLNNKLLAAHIPITLRYLTSAIETFYILGNAANVNAVWETYIDDQLEDAAETTGRIAPNSFCVRKRLWALGKTSRIREMDLFFDKWYRSGLFFADAGVYLIMLQAARTQKNPSRLVSILAEMKAKNIQLDQKVYNLAVSAFIDAGDSDRAKTLLDEMLRDGLLPNQTTFESLLLMASTRGTSAEDLMSVVKRAFSSGSFIPKGPSWRSALAALLQRAHPDDIAPIVSESLRLNPSADIDVLDALLTVNLERYFSSTSTRDRQSLVDTIDQLWNEARSKTHLLSDFTISSFLKYADVSKGPTHAFELAQTLASQLPTVYSGKHALSVVVRLFAQNNQFERAINLLRSAAKRQVRPLQPDAFLSIIRALAVDPTRVEPLILEYLALFGWHNSMTVHVCRTAVETVSKTQLVNSTRTTTTVADMESRIIPTEITADGIKPLRALVDLLDKEISGLSTHDPELTLILVEAHSLLALAILQHDQPDSERTLKRALHWFQEASRVGIDTNEGLVYRLSFAMIQTGGAYLLEGEKLLRRAQRVFKTATPRFLLRLLLRSKLAKLRAEYESSRQFSAKTPLLANISAELDEAISILHQLLDHWKDVSFLSSVMHHLSLDGFHGRYKALEIFYETLRKYHLQPYPAAFRKALALVSQIRDTADEYASGRVDEERRGSHLKREEALRLYDLYKRYRPVIHLSRSVEVEEAEETQKPVLFDAQVTKDLVRVMAEAGFLIEAERLADDLTRLSELEGCIASIPLIPAYARSGRLSDSARVFQKALDLPGVPHSALLESLRHMLYACAESDRLDVAWNIWNTLSALPQSTSNPQLGVSEWATMAFALSKRSDWDAVLKLFDQYRAKGDVEAATCLRFIRALKHLPAVTLEERGQLTLLVESSSPSLDPATVDQFRATIESWVRRAASNEVAALVSEL